MNLRESLDRWDDAMPDPLSPREVWKYAAAYVGGFGEAEGLRLVASTNGPRIRLHNLSNDTRSARIRRAGLKTVGDVRIAVQAQLDALPYWEPESDQWGPDPWTVGTPVVGE